MKREPLMVMVDAEMLKNEGRFQEAHGLLKTLVDELDDSEMEKRMYAARDVVQLGAKIYQKHGIKPDPQEMLRYATIALECYERVSPEQQKTFEEKYSLSSLKEIIKASKQEIEKPKSSGCFIATAVYGSPLAPEVAIFRQFRDGVLLASRLGTVFVSLYYFVSPPLASLISRHEFLRVTTRRVLLNPILHMIKK